MSNLVNSRKGLQAAGVFIFILCWQLSVSIGLISDTTLPGPVDVVISGFTSIPVNRLVEHIGISLFRVFAGFFFGATLGLVLGVYAGWYRKFGSILKAPIDLLRPIPPLAWIPLGILWLGIGEGSKIFIVFLGAFFPVFTISYKSMIAVDPIYIRVGLSMGITRIGLLTKIAVPSILPSVALSFRVALTYSFAAMVAAELIAADTGLGYLILNARELGDISLVIFGVCLIGTLSILCDTLLKFCFSNQLKNLNG